MSFLQMLFHFRVYLILLFLAVYVSVTSAGKDDFTRKIQIIHNPGCGVEQCKNDTFYHLIYARAEGQNDTLHYVLSNFGVTAPTILLLRSHHDSWLKIDWHRFMNNDGNVSGAVYLVAKDQKKVSADVESVIILNRILEYNDPDDIAVFNASMQVSPGILMKHLKWEASFPGDYALLVGSAYNVTSSLSQNSSISIKFTPFGHQGQSLILPSLPHNANSSQWDIDLISLLTRGTDSRFAVEIVVFGDQSEISKLKEKSMDDEYAPSVFTSETTRWIRRNDKDRIETYHKWRSVGYTAPVPARDKAAVIKSSAITTLNKTSPVMSDTLENHLLKAYFGSHKVETMLPKYFILSSGSPDDGFYIASNYSSWTSIVGFGDPIVDHFSTLVWCMLLVGVGCLVLVLVLGGIYTVCSRIKRSGGLTRKRLFVGNYDYQPISN